MSAGSDLVVERRPAPTYSVGPPREKREVRKTTLTGKLLGDSSIPVLLLEDGAPFAGAECVRVGSPGRTVTAGQFCQICR
jgi:hypothetical protein